MPSLYLNQRRYAAQMTATAESLASALESLRATLYCVLRKVGSIRLSADEVNRFSAGAKVTPDIDPFMGTVLLVPYDAEGRAEPLHVCATCASRTKRLGICRRLWRRTDPGFACSGWRPAGEAEAAQSEVEDGQETA